MAKAKKKKVQPPRKTRAELQAEQERTARRTKIALRIVAAVAVVAILTVAIIAIVNAVRSSERADVMNDDLGKYIYISPEDYENFPVSVKLDPVDKTAVESAYINALYKSRTQDPVIGADKYPVSGELPRSVIGVGDILSIRYIGYLTESDGSKSYFTGGCNFDDEDPYDLGIGSGGFVTGFELGLVGKDVKTHSALQTVTDRDTVELGDVVSVTMLAMYSDGTTAQKQSYSVVVEPESADRIWGEGFAEFLVGKRVGVQLKDENGDDISFKTGDVSDQSGQSVYTEITVNKVFERGDNPITVDAYFPLSYGEETLDGKWAKFDVYVEKIQFGSVPAVDENFVTEKLDMSVASLREYGEEGDSLADCYRAYLKSNLEAKAESEREDAVVETFWELMLERVKVKRLPQGDVENYYNSYLSDVMDYYKSQSDNYSSIDEFACTYLDIKNGSDWKAELQSMAQKSVTEKLIFYYIIREKDFLPSEEEHGEIHERIVTEMVDSALSQLKITPESENYQTKREEIRAEILEGYGDKYFEDQVIYEYGMKKIVSMAKIVES